MEIIQASQVSFLPQEASTATWSNNSVPALPNFLLLSTSSESLLSFTQADNSFLFNSTCQNCSKPDRGSLPGLAAIFIPLIYGLVCVVGLLGNTLVIHVIAISATVWAGSFVVVLPVVVFADVLKEYGDCSIVWPEPAAVWKTSFIVYTCTVGFFCPLLVICLCYLLIVIKVRSVGKRAQATSSRRRKSERKITRMVVVVVVVFVLCWLPFYALNIANLLMVLPGDFRGLYFFVVVLSYANSCANPILYGFLSDNFKRGFRKALCRTSRRVKNNDKVCTEVQRPTEEWGGIVLQTQRIEGATNMHSKDCGEKEEEEEINRADGSIQMSDLLRISQNGNNRGVTEDSRTQTVQRAKREPESSGQSTKHGEQVQKGPSFDPAEGVSSLASRSGNSRSQPEAHMDENSVLEISYL
ncbi:somatostatin receptor type 5 [Scomber scombrus]|uniref:Somatostatin receptor type 5 n=1 Tax=Scomber scombrus TaxID=13677 RepID=A0AAV1PWM7_SCOSC